MKHPSSSNDIVTKTFDLLSTHKLYELMRLRSQTFVVERAYHITTLIIMINIATMHGSAVMMCLQVTYEFHRRQHLCQWYALVVSLHIPRTDARACVTH